MATGSSLDNSDISSADTATPSFTPDVAGSYVLELPVSDGKGGSDIGTVSITSITAPANTPPVANAGTDASTTVGSSVNLDGSASSDDDSDLFFNVGLFRHS